MTETGVQRTGPGITSSVMACGVYTVFPVLEHRREVRVNYLIQPRDFFLRRVH